MEQEHLHEKRIYPETPMDLHRPEIIECLKNSHSAVIVGETGSGKTTRIPDFLIDEFPEAKIAITQPRRVAARSVARYVAERKGVNIGERVGYQVRFDDKTTEGTAANFMTDGVLLRKLQNDPLLEEFDIVMVDEAHERSLNIDFTLGLLKKVQQERKRQNKKELKIVVTSATIEKEKFSEYFNGSPTLNIEGRMYPVDIHYEKGWVHDYKKVAAEKVQDFISSGKKGDVLIFMPGEIDINLTIIEINELQLDNIEILPLFGAMAPEDQDKIFAESDKRKIIVATNIAETSLTVPGVECVIDSGLIKQKEFDPRTGIESLIVTEHAKSGCDQRTGRAGRTAPGTCYRLYSQESYEERAKYAKPEIARSDLAHIVLTMKKMGIDDVRDFDFIDKPNEETFLHAIESLKTLGALDENENLTKMGETMAELPLKPELSRIIIEAEKYGCVGSICTIAAMMGGQKPVFARPKDKETQADNAHRKFKKDGSDFMTSLEVWKQWSSSGFNDKWAHDNFLNVRQLFEIREVRSQLLRELSRLEIIAEDSKNDPESIQKSIAAGLIQNLAVPTFSNFGYKKVSAHESGVFINYIFTHPASSVFGMRPDFMIASEVVTTSKTFARKCQTVDPQWLPEIAPQILVETGKLYTYDIEKDSAVQTIVYALKDDQSITFKYKTDAPAEINLFFRDDPTFIEGREKYIKLKPFVDAITFINHESLGFSLIDLSIIKSTLREVEEILSDINGNYAQAVEKIDEIESTIGQIKKKEEEKALVILEIRKEVDSLTDTVGEINPHNYRKLGLSMGEYEFIKNRWYMINSVFVRGYMYADLHRAEDFLVQIKTILSDKNIIEKLKEEADRKKLSTVLEEYNAKNKILEQEKKEKTPEEIKTDLLDRLYEADFLANDILSTKEVDVQTRNTEKISKLKIKAKEILKDVRSLRKETEQTDTIISTQGKVIDVERKAKKAAEEIAYVQGKQQDWPDTYRPLLSRFKEIAEKEGVPTEKTFMEKARVKIIEMAKTDKTAGDIDAKLMTILLDII